MSQQNLHIEVLDAQGKALKHATVQLIRPDGSFLEGKYSKKKKAYLLEVSAPSADRYGLSVSCEGYHPTGKMLRDLPEQLSFSLASAKEAKELKWPLRKWRYEEAAPFVHLEFRQGSTKEQIQRLLEDVGLELANQSQIYQKKDGSPLLRYFDPTLKALRTSEWVEIAAPVLRVFKEEIKTGTPEGKSIDRGEKGALFPVHVGLIVELYEETLENHTWIDAKLPLWGMELAPGYEYLKKRKKSFVKQKNKQPNIILVQEPDSVRDYRSPLLLEFKAEGTGLGMLDLIDELNHDNQVKNTWFLKEKGLR